MKVLIVFSVLFFISVAISRAGGLSGSYSGNGVTYKFVDGANVDIVSNVKEIIERGPSGIKYGPDTTQVDRGRYTVLSAQEYANRINDVSQKGEDMSDFTDALKKYTREDGYERWITISVSDGIYGLFVESNRSIVNVFTGKVYSKSWYSR